jgi:hypothetical protein
LQQQAILYSPKWKLPSEEEGVGMQGSTLEH